MATASDIFCDICASQDKTNPAIKWCPECEEALCSDCIKHHSVSKLSRNHETISIADNEKLADSVSNVQVSCTEHNENFQLFCPHHDIACCAQCVSSGHADCKGLLAIVELVKNAKTSSVLEDVEEMLNVIRTNIEIIIKDRLQNLKDVQSQFKKMKTVINETRERLVKHIDDLEKKLLEEIMCKEIKIKEELEKVITDMKDKDVKIQKYQENIKVFKEYGTDIQTFFGTREIAKCAQTEETNINVLFENETLNKFNIQVEADENMNKILHTKTFGTLLLTTTEPMVKPLNSKNKAAQIGKALISTKSIDDMKVTLKTKFRVSSGSARRSITGCDIAQDGRLVFVDCNNNQRIVVHNVDGTYINEICISPDHPFDVSVVDDQSVVVSSPVRNIITQVNITTNKTIKYISTRNRCDGVLYSNGNVISAIYNQGIISYCMHDNRSTLIKTDALGYNSYVTCCLDKIYYTNRNDNTVTCLSLKGEVMWTFSDKSLVSGPRSIATDQHGNVFVSSSGNNTIVVIPADGQHGRTILDEKDGINNAWAMCYDKSRDKLVVANWSGDVFVFDIS